LKAARQNKKPGGVTPSGLSVKSFVLFVQASTAIVATALVRRRPSEASSPTQQHAQVDAANTMTRLSHGACPKSRLRGLRRDDERHHENSA
jgi:hypothetical protein